MEDPYHILGVGRNASDEEIKKAWRAKAIRNHPDKGGSEEDFKRINNAYENIQKGNHEHAPFPFDIFTEHMHQMFTGPQGPFFHMPSRAFTKQNVYRVIDVKLDLSSFFIGKNLQLNVNNKSVIVNISPMTPINSVIDVPDVNVQIRLKPKKHSMFDLDMYQNLILNESISLYEALTGFCKKIKLPSGKSIVVKTLNCIKTNHAFIVRNCGMPVRNNATTHLIVNLSVILPHNTNFQKDIPYLKQLFNVNVPPCIINEEDKIVMLTESI